MKSLRLLLPLFATLMLLGFNSPAAAGENPYRDVSGLHIGTDTTDRVGFHNALPTVQRAGAAEVALTDSTTGTAVTTLAAGVGRATITIKQSSLATGLSTSAIDILTAYTLGYRFKILAFDYVTTTVGTGTSASQSFNLAIGSTAVTGGVVNDTLASTATIGAITAGTAVTAANVGLATDTLSIKMAAGGTVFTAGAGYFVIKIQNMDTADAIAGIIAAHNEIRAALVEKGLIKGAP